MTCRCFPLLLVALLAGLPCGPAGAADLLVTSDADDGEGSLREAIQLANSSEGPDTITFARDFTIRLASTLPVITSKITIIGNGWSKTILDAGRPTGAEEPVRPLEIAKTGDLTLEGVMVKSAFPAAAGGAVLNHGGTFLYRDIARKAPAIGYGGHLARPRE